jgi:hypothetical protein
VSNNSRRRQRRRLVSGERFSTCRNTSIPRRRFLRAWHFPAAAKLSGEFHSALYAASLTDGEREAAVVDPPEEFRSAEL